MGEPGRGTGLLPGPALSQRHVAVGIAAPDVPVVLEWIRDDVPLSVVEKAIDETAKRQRGRGQQVRIRVAYLDIDVRRIWRVLRRRLGPCGADRRERMRPQPGEGDRDRARRNRIATLRLAIERHGARAKAGDLKAWRDEMAGLEAEEGKP